ncbi:histidine--tRNA ligase [Butyribacter intestini]|jgi:histidyl-tRNA synthetase|uniref:Histidine--tRNA ligase n=1 Tax=Butyribacter intestini TaxID=1703332 RepID=A0AAW3JQD7_9FIRM|nr:histidine--tRNA ligase [Butyribacter intestini]KQC84657.1 histidine--tRNA ligase [Butyribacter intestini]RHU73932.1 histidine--tRNA ligase [Butyribacter intestini]
MKSTPVKGTRDYLPKEVEIRDYLQNVIAETYRDAGFVRITTPIIEDAVNLDKSEGGENLNLIFRVLKRGKKLSSALNNENVTEKELSDMGLRYDLTLPLSRYFSNNKNELMTPFKVIQMDRVYRAERPQKGRLREFMQCDIDIIGNDSRDAEIELILTTTKALNRVGLKNYTVKINDRRILKSIFSYTGFDDADNEKLAIIFDKLDKIGIDGVKAELEENSFDKNAIDKFIGLFENGSLTLDSIADVCDAEYVNDLKYIIDTVDKASNGTIPVEFTPSLVRGQGYYTGTIFEVAADGYSGAVAGGGRYDNLIGKFLNEDIPAVGFSIGFERIFGILMEQNYAIPDRKKRIAVFYDKDNYADALVYAENLRNEYMVSVIARPKKLGKFLNKLEQNEFDGFAVFGEADGVKLFG